MLEKSSWLLHQLGGKAPLTIRDSNEVARELGQIVIITLEAADIVGV